jgi:hypothetical protein
VSKCGIPDETIAVIRKRAAAGERPVDLAAEYGIPKWTVYTWLRRARRGAVRKAYTYLSDKQVCELRTRAANGEPLSVLSREFGIARNSADKLVQGHRRQGAGGPLRHQWPPRGRRALPRKDFWSAAEDAMAMSLPVRVVAQRTGRSEEAVWSRRTRLRKLKRKQESIPCSSADTA